MSELKPSTRELHDKFFCDHYGQSFPFKTCLRRQVERLELTKGGKAAAGPFARPWCAEKCTQRLEVCALFPDVHARSCDACGEAVVSRQADAVCPRCLERKGLPTKPAKLSAPTSTRIWTEPQPDVPFVPPNQHTTAAPMPPEPKPVEEPMPKGIRKDGPCPTCKSMSTCCACKRGKKAAPVRPAKRATLDEVAEVRGPAKPDLVVLDSTPAKPPCTGLAAMSLDELLELRRNVETELHTRRDRAREEAARIERELVNVNSQAA